MKNVLILIVVLFGNYAYPTENSKKEIISTSDAPEAIGPYSQAVRVGNTLYLSGQIAIDPIMGKLIQGSIEDQTHQVLKNIKAVLNATGFTLGDVVQSQVFLSDLNNYGAMNKIYASYFSIDPPARAAIQAARLPLDALIEIMVIAVK
ncbi:MAG: RidA family protein [Candidatus Marinimicrobia bacterium]|jgi:2-iminobutanoate/2-iminopropanoate deaminase|nr:RidA family protein [Candidatus Neomarinimicrobiota bacterium]MBT3840015.1 RidA family protein [Candidatus Neomarinimicrobiota bacterium]MBT4000047.1 RidA family protein [Candidatus Neomarinimicrobiota bacterium]MBT4282154.1 RidA family protein [Candidatus Neomarinimicrobiota bacterium]MBT4578893.1 RidA family protein [Candidatus Neomarinimicrobiota bacterium]